MQHYTNATSGFAKAAEREAILAYTIARECGFAHPEAAGLATLPLLATSEAAIAKRGRHAGLAELAAAYVQGPRMAFESWEAYHGRVTAARVRARAQAEGRAY